MRLISAGVLVHREISENAAAVGQRRQKFYLLTGARKTYILYICKIKKIFGCFYHFIGENAVELDGVVALRLR